MFHWGLNDPPDCNCRKPQTAQHIIYHCTFLDLQKKWTTVSSKVTTQTVAQTVGRHHMTLTPRKKKNEKYYLKEKKSEM